MSQIANQEAPVYSSVMLKIYITRHGQNIDNANGILNGHRDEPLTSLGEEQALLAGKKIQEEGLLFDAVYSSPLVRALKTAQIISDTSGQPSPIVKDALIERNFGVMSGCKASDIEAICAPDIIKTDTVTYFLSPEGAETFPDCLLRAKKFLAEIKELHAEGSVLLVGHGDFGKMLYAAFYDIPWEDALTSFHFGNSEVLVLAQDTPAEERILFKSQQFNN